MDELEQFLLNHGENIVDLMGGEIDRIEMKLRVNKIFSIPENQFKFYLLQFNFVIIIYRRSSPRLDTVIWRFFKNELKTKKTV